MKRRGSHRPAITIALFPFLAVLICTMGVIIVMLVIVVRQASKRATDEVAQQQQQTVIAAEVVANAEKKAREVYEDLEWQKETLAGQRESRREELTNLRQRVAHVEDHLRRLQAQAKQLLEQARDVDTGKKLEDSELLAAQQELTKVKELIAKTQREHEELKQKLQLSQRWFALIPYDGPNGTRRRPIYIECSEAGIILQPEGLTLMPDDFNGPMGPGNPLDAALRAKREHMERSGETGLPYPLLIVRPDGIVAYMAARAALKSWDEEFGYELIDAEKKLVYGQADPTFAQTLEQIVRQARKRQAALAAAMPRKFSQEDTLTSFRTSDALGDTPEIAMAAGRGVGGSRAGGSGTGTAGTRAGGSGAGNGNTRLGGTGTGPGGNRPGAPGANLTKGGVGSGGTGNGGIGTGTEANFSSGAGTGGGPESGQRFAGGSQPYRSGGTDANGSQAGSTPNSLRGGASGGNSGGTSAPGGVPGGPNASGSASGSNMAGGSSFSQSGGQTGGQLGSFSPGGSQDANGNPTSGNPSSGNPSDPSDSSAAGGSSANMTFSQSKNQATKRRGQNWGLPNSVGRSVAVTRPIRVECRVDRVVIYPERGDVISPSHVRLHDSEIAPQEIDSLVHAVQKQIQGWGIAAQNGYWKPILTVEVAPDANQRFEQLETALRGSGYDVQRKQR